MDKLLRDLLVADFEATVAAGDTGPIVVDNPPELLEAVDHLERVLLQRGELHP